MRCDLRSRCDAVLPLTFILFGGNSVRQKKKRKRKINEKMTKTIPFGARILEVVILDQVVDSTEIS